MDKHHIAKASENFIGGQGIYATLRNLGLNDAQIKELRRRVRCGYWPNLIRDETENP